MKVVRIFNGRYQSHNPTIYWRFFTLSSLPVHNIVKCEDNFTLNFKQAQFMCQKHRKNFNATSEPSDVTAMKTLRYAANKNKLLWLPPHIFPLEAPKLNTLARESLLVSSTFLLIIIHKSYRHRRIKGSSSEWKTSANEERKQNPREKKNTEI